jgi:hypothetical protein
MGQISRSTNSPRWTSRINCLQCPLPSPLDHSSVAALLHNSDIPPVRVIPPVTLSRQFPNRRSHVDMSSGLQRRRVPGGPESSSLSPATSRPESNHNSFSGGSSPAVAGQRSSDGIDSLDHHESDHRIAFDPRDMAEGEERLKFPKLTMMEEVLLLGLKDKQVRAA